MSLEEPEGELLAPPPPKRVEIHFDERVIDHPVVPIRWCLSPETTAYMRAHPEYDWALIIVAQKVGIRDEIAGVTRGSDPRAESREIIEGFGDISVGRGFFTFRGAGAYYLVAYLVHSLNEDHKSGFWREVRGLKTRYRDERVYKHRFDADAEDDKPVNRFVAEVFAREEQRVLIPDGIFAAEMKPWLRNYLKFFKLGVGEDECAGRWRIGLAFTLMPLLYAILYIPLTPITRAYVLFVGIVHFLLGGDPLRAWRHIFSSATILPRKMSHWFAIHDFRAMPFYEDEKNILLVPGIPFALFGIPAIGFMFSASVGWMIISVYLCIAVLIGIFALILGPLSQALEKSAEEDKQRKHNQVIDRVERYVLCGAAEERGTVELFWSGIKRAVCKPRQYAR
ncbi:MAG TPA: hypothetical protein VEB18_03420 [Candidatus Paceibacterota bacterium]|nr:hypothetical protein [Candidatus Paceibacterota bacterium]